MARWDEICSRLGARPWVAITDTPSQLPGLKAVMIDLSRHLTWARAELSKPGTPEWPACLPSSILPRQSDIAELVIVEDGESTARSTAP
jgi:hypothetical protein